MVKLEADNGNPEPQDGTRRSRNSSWLSGYWFVLALLTVSYVLSAVQQTANPGVVPFLVQLVTVAITLRVAEVRAGIRRIGWILLTVAGVAAIIVELMNLSGRTLDIVLSSASIASYLVAPVAIIEHQSKKKIVDGQTLLASISAYVMIGMLFTFTYNLISLTTDSPLFGEDEVDSLTGQLFFSFTTLTTTGYGNLIPSGPLVQSVAIVEAITGQLFLVIAVARVVAVWRPSPR